MASVESTRDRVRCADAARRPAAASLPEAVRRLGRVHHVALIVRSIDDALGLWRDALDLELETVMDIPDDRVRIAFLGVGESKIELVEPTDDTTGVARFLANKGEGFHHVCFEVANLAETLLRLEIDGIELIDTAPRRGAEGPVAFLHPRSCHGVLVELIEAPGGPAWVVARLLSGSDRRAPAQPASSPATRTSAGSSPPASGGSRHIPSTSSSSTRKSTFQSRNGCSTSVSIRRPASISADHDLAQAVIPAVLGLLADVGVRVGIRALDLEDQRLRMLPVRVAQPELAGRDTLVLEGLDDRMDLGDEERPAGRQEVGDDPRPAADVGQPAEHAARGVDDVEGAVERRRQVVQVRADEARVREAELVAPASAPARSRRARGRRR